jgi:hypothetical protein
MRVPTRYFAFTRINPEPGDYLNLHKAVDIIDAFLCYRTGTHNGRKILKGVLVLRGKRTCPSGCTLESLFPNFLLRHLPDNRLDFDFHALPRDVVVKGVHPFDDLRRDLFKVGEKGTLYAFLVSTY